MDDQEQGQDSSYNASSVCPVDLCERVNSEYSEYWFGRLTYKEHCYKTDQCSYCRSPPCEKPRGLSPGSWNTKIGSKSAYLKVGLKFGALPIFRRKQAKLVTQNVIRYVIVTKLR